MGTIRAACPIAFVATAGFAVFEGVLDHLLHVVDPATLFALRAAVTLPLLLVLLRLFGRSLGRELRRIAPHPLHWIRGLCWSATAFLMLMSFWNTDSLTETYALMLLHPLWTVVLTRMVLREAQDWRPYGGCFALLAAGLALYGFGDGVDLGSYGSYVMPIAAGAAFALTNLVGIRIKRELQHDALTKTAGSTVIAILVSPLVLALMPPDGIAGLGAEPIETVELIASGLLVAAASGLALLANIGMSFAFDTARNAAVIAAIDTAIIGFGVVLDLLFSPGFDLGAWLGLQGLGMAAMTIGAVWAAIKLERGRGRQMPAPVLPHPAPPPRCRATYPARALAAAGANPD